VDPGTAIGAVQDVQGGSAAGQLILVQPVPPHPQSGPPGGRDPMHKTAGLSCSAWLTCSAVSISWIRPRPPISLGRATGTATHRSFTDGRYGQLGF
jgi:hypothetical protein